MHIVNWNMHIYMQLCMYRACIYVQFQISHHNTYNPMTHSTYTVTHMHARHKYTCKDYESREKHNRIIGWVSVHNTYYTCTVYIWMYLFICRWRHQRMTTINIQMDNGVIHKKKKSYYQTHTLYIQTHAAPPKSLSIELLVSILTPKQKRADSKNKKQKQKSKKQYILCVWIYIRVEVVSNYIAANLRW